MMLRKTFLAVAAVAAVGLFTPNMASAFGGGGHGGGGGCHGGGFGGFHGGGFGGFHGGGFRRGFGFGGYGFYGPYGYYGGYGYPYYDDYYADEGGCYIVRRRV